MMDNMWEAYNRNLNKVESTTEAVMIVPVGRAEEQIKRALWAAKTRWVGFCSCIQVSPALARVLQREREEVSYFQYIYGGAGCVNHTLLYGIPLVTDDSLLGESVRFVF